MKDKLRDNFFLLKTYWKKPQKGFDVSFKEFFAFCFGSSSASIIQPLVTYTALSIYTPFFAKYFGLTNGSVLFLSWIAMAFALFRAPILSMIIDNSNSPKGKFLPLLTWSLIGTAIGFTMIPYIPSWLMNLSAFNFKLPTIAWLAIKSSIVNINWGLLIAFLLLQFGTFFFQIFCQSIIGVEQTITKVSQERANIASLKGLLANIPGSIIGTLFPFVAALVIGGLENVILYRILFPICGVLAVAFVFIMVRGVKERVVLEKDHIAKVKFWEGAKQISKNKYFWLFQIFGIFLGIRGVATGSFTYWITTYGLNNLSESMRSVAFALANTFLPMAFTPAMLLAPLFVKKFGKKSVMVFSEILYIIVLSIQVLFHKNMVVMLACLFVQNFCLGLQLLSAVMMSDSLDYQQWLTGKRLEGFWQNYAAIISTIAGFFIAPLLPLFQSFGGLNFDAKPAEMLVIDSIRNNVFKYVSLLALIGAVGGLIPLLFFDLSEKKHANIIKALQIRAGIKNFENGNLDDSDIINIKEISIEATNQNNVFVLQELSKCHNLDKIVSDYEGAIERTNEKNQIEQRKEFERNVDLEKKRLLNKLDKSKNDYEKSIIKNNKSKNPKNILPYNQQQVTDNFILNSFYLIDLEENEHLKAQKDEKRALSAKIKKDKKDKKGKKGNKD